MNSKLKIFLTIVITALVAGGGVYLWQNPKQEAPVNKVEETVVEEEAITPEINETTMGEKDYTWSEYNIAFDYPTGWNVYETHTNIDGENADGLIITESEITGATGGGFEIEIYAITHLTLEERLNNLNEINSFEDAGHVRIGEITFRLVYYDIFNLRRPRYLIEKNGVLYQFNTQSESIVEDTLESLRFL